MKMKKLDKTNRIRLVAAIIFIVATLAMTLLLIPVMRNLMTEEGRQQTAGFIGENGAWGIIVFLFFQVLQVVVALIPGEPLEIVAGMLFGMWQGLFLCLLGILMGTSLVYMMVRKVGYPLVTAFVSKEKLESMKLLKDERRLELFVFLLFLIPGTPKDTLTYFVPLTKIRPARYFLLATLARIPSVVSSTILGSTLSDGNFVLSAVIFLATLLLGAAGILLNKKITKNNAGGGSPWRKHE